MAVDDLGDFDVEPVEGNPFGAMAASPNDYHVAPVDHDPFQVPARYQAMPTSPNIEDRRGQPRPPPDPSQQYTYGGGPDYDPWAVPIPHRSIPPPNPDQARYLQAHLPTIPLTPLRDPDFSLDPSIMAQIRAPRERAAAQAQAQAQAQAREKWQRENPLPTGPRGGPQLLSFQGGGGVTDLGESDDDAFAGQSFAGPDPVPDAPPPMTSKDILAQGGLGSISAASFAPSDQARQLVQMGLEGAGMQRGAAQDISGNFATEAGYLPISGQALSGADALYHAGRGEYGEAAASGLGAVPDIGGPLAHGVGAVFAGPMARTADRAALEQAQAMASKGAAPSRIWNKTGWWQGPESKWRYEIPDYQAEFDPRGGNVLGDVLHHPDLYAAYPELADVAVDRYPLKKGQTGVARFTPPQVTAPKGEIAFGYPTKGSVGGPTLTGALHETQHAIQDIPEQFSPGGTPPRQVDPTSPAWPFIEARLRRGDPGKMSYADFVKRTTGGPYQYLTQFHPDKIENAVNQGRYDYYNALAGEVESRNVEERYKMGPLLARTTPPWSKYSQSLPYSKQVVKPPWGAGFQEGGGVTDLGSDDDFAAQPDAFSAPPDQFELASRQPEATPSSAGGPPLDPGDRDLLIKTVYGEAADQPPLGQAGIAHAILNRVRAGGYGQSIRDVVMEPAAGVNPRLGYHEFSPWNPKGVAEGQPRINTLEQDNPRAYAHIGDIVDKAYSGLIPDPTGGATHYYGRMPSPPRWAAPLAALNKVKIAGTTFVGREHGPGQTIQTAGGYAGGGPVQLNEDLRRRLATLTRPRYQSGGDVDPNAAGFSALDKMTSDWRAAQPPDQPAPDEPQPQVYGGKWGQAAEDAFQTGMGYVGAAQQWLGDKAEHYTGSSLAALGVPAAPQLARDLRGIVESGEFGGMHEPEVPVARYNHPSFPEGRIATRVPTSAALADTAHLSNDAKIGLDTMQSVPAFYDKTAAKAREMPYEPGPVVNNKPTWTATEGLNIPADATPDEVHDHLVNHFTSNILALHDAVDPEIQPGSQKWYEGANARAIQKAQLYGKPLENVAGAYAAMSPKMDWFQNVSLSERLMDIVHNQGDTAFTPEMQAWVNSRYGKAKSPADLKAQGIFNRINGSTLNQLDDPLDKAHWVRAYDQAHNSRDYNIVNPDGTFARTATNDDGSNSKAAWGNGYEPIAKAIRAFTANDMPTVSAAMGDAHKVRSFYNNIVAPWSDHGDVTVDTHAIAAALLRPLAGDDKDVSNGLGMGGPDHAGTGMHGLYGAYVEAYRKAAEARNILPRQMQSITWEALRGLWNPEEKASADIRAGVSNVWQRFKNGEIDLPTAQRELIYDPETGESRIKPPDWHTAGWRP